MVAKTRPKKGLVFLFVWYNELMNKRNRVLVSVVGAVLVGAGIFCNNVFAADSTESEFSVTIAESSTLVIPSSPVNITVEPTAAGVFADGSFNIRAFTNNSAGYKVLMSTQSSTLVSNTIDITSGDFYTIPTLSNNATSSNFELNKWGISIDSGTTYIPMPTDDTQIMFSDAATTASGEQKTINYATKLDLNTVPGTYSTTIKFTMVANVVPEEDGGHIDEDSDHYDANS